MESLEKLWLERSRLTFYPKPVMTDAGILFGAGTMLLPRATIHPEHAGERALALMAIAQRAPVDARYLRHFRKSMAAWGRGERAIAQFHLAYAGISPLRDKADAKRLFLAETLIEEGFLPLWLAKEVNQKPDRPIEKYSPDQPRNPAGSGEISGRWTSGDGPAVSPNASNPELTPVAYNGYYHDKLLNAIIEDLQARDSTVVKSVRITSYTGITAIADAIVLPKGSMVPYVLEVKTGYDPTFTINQRFVYPFVCLGGHAISADSRLPQLNLIPGIPLLPLKVLVVYSPGEGKVFYDDICKYVIPVDKNWSSKNGIL